jgi:Domain of unknown function (DUF4430)
VSRGRFPGFVAAAALVAVAAPGCGLGPGESSEGEARLTVTRDYGAERLLEATVSDPSASETVIRVLDREAEITTRYGGGFVQSIDGVEGDFSDGRSLDWFFFVNGIESSRGSAEVPVRAGDRVWWDYRDWTDALRTPAVVGSWPEPFAQASAGTERLPVRIECHAPAAACDTAAERLSDEGVDASVERAPASGAEAAPPALRLLVGPWRALRSDPLAAQLDLGPQGSGVFARFERRGAAYELVALDEWAEEVDAFGAGAGLVAGLRRGERPAGWVVTGTDAAGVDRAVGLLDADDLEDRYAVLAAEETELALPAPVP